MMVLMCRCVLYPGCKLFVTSGGKIIIIFFGNYNDVSNFLNWIYKDSNIFLDRKYNKYLDFIENESKYHKK